MFILPFITFVKAHEDETSFSIHENSIPILSFSINYYPQFSNLFRFFFGNNIFY